MRPVVVRRALRLGLVTVISAVMTVGLQGVVQGAEVIGQTGTHGAYTVTDTVADPGASCKYEGAAGTWYLQRLAVPAPTIYGASSHLRSVGYRLLLQRRSPTGWVTKARGTLISGVADRDTAATLTGSNVVRDPETAGVRGRYRAALKLIWWDATARVEGTVTLAIEHHLRDYDDSVGAVCKGRLPIG